MMISVQVYQAQERVYVLQHTWSNVVLALAQKDEKYGLVLVRKH